MVRIILTCTKINYSLEKYTQQIQVTFDPRGQNSFQNPIFPNVSCSQVQNGSLVLVLSSFFLNILNKSRWPLTPDEYANESQTWSNPVPMTSKVISFTFGSNSQMSCIVKNYSFFLFFQKSSSPSLSFFQHPQIGHISEVFWPIFTKLGQK